MSTMQESPHRETLTVEGETTHAKSWLAPVLAILALVLGLIVGGVLGRSSVDDPVSESTPSPAVLEVLSGRIEAVNGGNADEIAAYYSADAVLEERDVEPAVVTTTNTAIGERLAGIASMGFQLHPTGDIIVTPTRPAVTGWWAYGKYAAETLEWTTGAGVCVYEFDEQLKIVHQWVIGGVPS